MGVALSIEDWQTHGHDIPLLVNCQPAGEYLGEGYHRAGGVPAVLGELIRAGSIANDALTCACTPIGALHRAPAQTPHHDIPHSPDPLFEATTFPLHDQPPYD